MPMGCQPLKEDLFAGVAWSAVVALLALEKLRQGETLSDDERFHVSKTAAFAFAMFRMPDKVMSEEDDRRHRRFWIVSSFRVTLIRDLLMDLISSLDQSSLYGLTAGELARVQKNLYTLLNAINRCRA